MANQHIKPEGGHKPGSRGRWMKRIDAKRYAKKARRRVDAVYACGLEHSTERLVTHPLTDCYGQICAIHNRSLHSMRAFSQHWRGDRHFLERICPHGVGHPDPDDCSGEIIHGCDGCCS